MNHRLLRLATPLVALCFLTTTAFAQQPDPGLPLADGTVHVLGSHPNGQLVPPPYGLRLDGLFLKDNARTTFDFNPSPGYPDVYVRMSVTETSPGEYSYHITGRAFGGIESGSAYHPGKSGYFDLDYTIVEIEEKTDDTPLGGDEDWWVPEGSTVGTGTITAVDTKAGYFTAGDVWDLRGFSNGEYTFRIGDDENDNGYKGHGGNLSGWGWVEFSDAGADDWYGNNDAGKKRVADWVFLVIPCESTTPGAITLADPGWGPTWDGVIYSNEDGTGHIRFTAPGGLQTLAIVGSNNLSQPVPTEGLDGSSFGGGDWAPGAIPAGFPHPWVWTYSGSDVLPPPDVRMNLDAKNTANSYLYVSVTDACGTITTIDPPMSLNGPSAASQADLPSSVELEQNYPNPFNPTTSIRFTLPAASDVRVVVYDMLGREVATLLQGSMDAGAHTVSWNGRNAAGALVPSGMYLYRLEAGSFSQTKQMTLLK